MHELSCVSARGNPYQYRMGGSLIRLVKLLQPLAKGVEGDPDDRVSLGVEVRLAPKRLDGDRVFLDLVAASGRRLFADVAQHFGQVQRTTKHSGLKQPVEFCTLREFQPDRLRDKSHCGFQR